VGAALLTAGCRQDMHDQPKYEPYERSTFFADQRSARPLVEGTVARGQLRNDERLYSGKSGAVFAAEFPLPVTAAVLRRGQDRYAIYCTPCHGLTGDGVGIVVQRGYRRPNSFHIDRLRTAPVGYFFDVQTRGFGAMMDYSAQIPVEDRWAIAAYVRALQLSQGATISDVPPSERPLLESPNAPPKPPPLPIGGNDWGGAPGISVTPPPAASPSGGH
jgi:mono/diheme cytochrome c family protein